MISSNNPNLNKNDLLFAASQTHFLFNARFYNQIDGIVMSSCLDPILPNTFREYCKAKWLKECNFNKYEFYLRYVGDTQVAFGKEEASLH